MTRHVIDYQAPDRAVVGTVGQPGERTFFLQVREGSSLTSVVLEKSQAAALADRLDQLLDEARDRGHASAIPSAASALDRDSAALDAPIVEEFRVGAMALGWDEAHEQVVVEAHSVMTDQQSIPEIGDDSEEGPDTLRFRLTASAARAFAERTRTVVAAGRPPCPFCSQPLDPEGHICPRANGYRRRA